MRNKVFGILLSVLILFSSVLTVNTVYGDEEIINDEEAVQYIEEDTSYETSFGYIAPEDENPEDYIVNNEISLYSDYLPAAYSLKDEGYITSVKDQYPYGTCWAFASVASIESNLLMKYGKEYDLSELQLAYFAYNKQGISDSLKLITNDYTYSLTENSLQAAGNAVSATIAMASGIGLIDENSLPYENAGSSIDNSLCFRSDYYLDDVLFLSMSQRDVVKTAIRNNGAVVSAYRHDDYYYNNSSKGYYYNGEDYTNHAITIVGWDDNYSRSNFNIDPGADGAWLCKNSWGERFGDKGYFYISYYDTSISNESAYSFSAEDDRNYDIYQYDGNVTSMRWNFGTNKVTYASKYTAQDDILIKEIGLFIGQADTDYVIDIYKNCLDKPDSGNKICTLEGNEPFAGFHTYDLDEILTVREGETFSIVVRVIANSSSTVSVFCSNSGNTGYLSHVDYIEPGQSYILPGNYGSLQDTAEKGYTVRLKVYTEKVSIEEVEYPITYVLNGGSLSGMKESYRENDETYVLPEPVRNGYEFAGWYSDSSFKNAVRSIESGSTGARTFYAKWKPLTYTITYVLNGATVSGLKKTYTVEDEDYILPSATKTGYEFLGWQENGKFSDGIKKGEFGDRTFTAVFDEINYSIIYHTDGGILKDALNSYTVVDSYELPVPVKMGYKFEGWFTDDNFKNPVSEIVEGSTGDKEFYARWSIVEYEIIYELNGGTAEILKEKYTVEDDAYVLPSVTKTGYEFVGWKENDAYVSEINQGETGDRYFEAVFNIINYSIIYHPDGGILDEAIDSFTIEDSLELPEPVKEGYVFEGWYLDKDFNERIDTVNEGSYGNLELYARWSLFTYKISYELNGGYNPEDAISEYINGDEVLPVPYREGHTFGGWYLDGELIESLEGLSSDIVLSASWKENIKTVKINGLIKPKGKNVVTESLDNISILINNTEHNDIEISVKWNSEDEFFTAAELYELIVEIKPGNNYCTDDNLSVCVDGETLDYISVEDNIYVFNKYYEALGYDYLISYEMGDAYFDGEAVYGYDQGDNSVIPDAVLEGYIFNGWYKDSNYKTKITSLKGLKGDLTLYAKFTAITYKLAYNLNGGKGSSIKTLTYKATDEVVISENLPLRTGYEFTGWSMSKDNVPVYYGGDTVKGLNGNLKSGSTVTLYACFSEILPKSVSITGINTLMEGKSTVLKAEVTPDNALKKTVKWESLNTDILTVNSSGKVTAKKTEKAVTGTVKAYVIDHPEVCDSIDITVTPSVKSVTIYDEQNNPTTSKTVINIDPGDSDTYKLSASTSPSDAMDDIVWSSNNKNVTVDEDGTVHINTSKAKVKITAKATDGSNKSAYVTLNIAKLVKTVDIEEPETDILVQGKSVTLKATVDPSDAADKSLLWTVDNTSIASVSNGKVTAKKVSEKSYVTVTAQAKGGTAEAYDTYKFTVIPLATSVSLTDVNGKNIDKALVGIDPEDTESYKIVAASYPEDALDSFTYKSSNPKVATVDDKGNVTFLSNGKVTVTVTAADGSKKSSSVTFNVAKLIKKITLDETSEVASTKSITLTADIYPQDVANKKLKWESEDTSVATVSNGKVTAKKVNEIKTVTIKAYAQDGTDAYGECEVTVIPLVSSVSISDESFNTVDKKTVYVDYIEDEFYKLYATTYPENASDKVTWKSSNTKVATVDEDGLVNFIGKGKVTITATADDGSKKSSSVTFNSSRLVSEINVTYPEYLYKGKTGKIYVDIYPSDAANKTLKYTSDNTKVVKVDSKGKLTAVAEGTATITVSATDGSGLELPFDVYVIPFSNHARELHDYIELSGETHDSGKRYIGEIELFDDSFLSYSIDVIDNDTLRFSSMYDFGDYFYSVMFDYDVNNQKFKSMSKKNIVFGFIMDGSNTHYFSGLNMNAQDIECYGIYNFSKMGSSKPVPLSTEEFNRLANIMLQKCLIGCNSLIVDNLGFDLYDIGFYSFLYLND